MDALLYDISESGSALPNIHGVNLDYMGTDYSAAGKAVIKAIQRYGVGNIEKVVLRHGGITVNIDNQKVPFLASVQLGDLICSIINL